MRLTVVSLFILGFLLFPFHSFAQNKTTEAESSRAAATAINQKLTHSIQHYADSTLQMERRFSDSLATVVAFTVRDGTTRIDLLVDSLIVSAHDSLDALRKDTLHSLTRSLQQQLLAYGDTAKQTVSGPFRLFANELTKGKSIYSTCDSCEDDSDLKDRLGQFRDFVDSLDEMFHDTLATLLDEHKDTFQDRYETLRDSLVDVRDQLIENRLDEIDYQQTVATRLTISTDYSSHTTYRGRDNGVHQQMIDPTITFHHSSGFGAEVSAYWLDQTPKPWDGLAASVSYEFTTASIIGGEVSCTHFWFSDSSRSSKSVISNAFDASLSLNWPVLSLSVDGDLATGSASEFTLAFSGSQEFEIPLTLYNKITIEPTLTAVLGEQNSTLTALRTKGVKAKKGGSMFGILDYEVTVPVTIVLGPLTLSPSVVYIAPMNVIDLSTTKAFVDFEFGISLTFR